MENATTTGTQLITGACGHSRRRTNTRKANNNQRCEWSHPHNIQNYLELSWAAPWGTPLLYRLRSCVMCCFLLFGDRFEEEEDHHRCHAVFQTQDTTSTKRQRKVNFPPSQTKNLPGYVVFVYYTYLLWSTRVQQSEPRSWFTKCAM